MMNPLQYLYETYKSTLFYCLYIFFCRDYHDLNGKSVGNKLNHHLAKFLVPSNYKGRLILSVSVILEVQSLVALDLLIFVKNASLGPTPTLLKLSGALAG